MKSIFIFIMKKKKYFLFLTIVVLIFTSCPNFFNNTGPLQIDYSGVSLILEWEDDSLDISEPSAVNHYDVYYRSLGTLKWIYISSTNGPTKTFTIKSDETGYGKFEFAVQAIYNNWEKSDLHTSTDFSAWPAGGWYINWYDDE